jgi:glycosyltransferase involved in cell wall biosynthesis
MEVRALALPRRLLYETWHVLRRPHVERATGRVDLIHATGMAVPPATVPLLVTVHDLAFEHFPQHATRNGLRFFRQSLARTRADARLVLCPSDATRRDCVAAGIDAARVRVVPWGVDPVPTAEPDVAADVLARHGLVAGRYVLFVGTIEPRKNLATLAAAFARLGRDDLLLAIVGPAGWNQDVEPVLAPIRGRVRLTGHVPRAELDVLYAHAAAFCYPSLLEGFGMPVLEAMAAGAAVITSKGTSTEEVAGDAGVLVDPLDADDIAGAIARVVDDEDLAADLRTRSRARAATFTWADAARATVAAYHEALGR